MRLLLSHTASMTDGAGYWQVPLDGEFRKLLDDPKAWDAQHAPGTYWRYANVGFPLIGAVMDGRGVFNDKSEAGERSAFSQVGEHGAVGW